MEFIAPDNMRIEYYIGKKGEIPFHGIRYAQQGRLQVFPVRSHITSISLIGASDIVTPETQFTFKQDKNINRVSQSGIIQDMENILEDFSYFIQENIMDSAEAKGLCSKIATHAKDKTQQQTADALDMTLAKFKTVMFNAFTVGQTVLPVFVAGTRGMSGPREYAREKKDGTIVVPIDVVKAAKLGERVKFAVENGTIVGRKYAEAPAAS